MKSICGEFCVVSHGTGVRTRSFMWNVNVSHTVRIRLQHTERKISTEHFNKWSLFAGLEKNWSRLRLLMSQSRSHYNRSHKKHTFRPGRSHHSNHSHSRWFSLHTVINKRVSHSHNRNRSHKTCSHNRSHDRRSENSIAVTIAIATRESRSQSRSRKFLFVLFSTWSS